MPKAKTSISKRGRSSGAAESCPRPLVYTHDGGIPKLSVLDQNLLPEEMVYVEVRNAEAAWAVIRSMRVGDPLLAGSTLVAAIAVLGLAVDLASDSKTARRLDKVDQNSAQEVLSIVAERVKYLRTSAESVFSSPHLGRALDGVSAALSGAITEGGQGTVRKRVVNTALAFAEITLRRDVSSCHSIGKRGAEVILADVADRRGDDFPEGGLRLMTLGNTGRLSAAWGEGTALSVASELNKRKILGGVTVLETRPYGQGSRIAATEMALENMPNTAVAVDGASSYLMMSKGIDACVATAYRISANGDCLGVIGSHALATAAYEQSIPFYICAHTDSLDPSISCGKNFEVEYRPKEELQRACRMPERENVGAWNPMCDVTPAKYVSAIITEKGVIRKLPWGGFDVVEFVGDMSPNGAPKCPLSPSNAIPDGHLASTSFGGGAPEPDRHSIPTRYAEQTVETLPLYISQHAPRAMEILQASSFVDLDCVEMGDGNMNLVFIMSNMLKDKKVVVKQAVPYVRCVGESWPLTLDRSWYEYQALLAEREACPEHVPEIYHFSKPMGLIVMEYIPPPNMILRKGFIRGIRYPTVASDMGIFCAKTLFKTSGFKLSCSELRKKVEFWSQNTAMCSLTEQVVFTEPYIKSANNRWTSPQLDGYKKNIESDTELKLAVAKLKSKFVTQTEALLHADLHTGSVMCSPFPGQTFVIDPEFGFYGPMGFDIGAFVANLLLAYVSQQGQSNGRGYDEWILMQIDTFWNVFKTEFLRLWDNPLEHTGDAYQRELFTEEHSLSAAQNDFMTDLFQDTLGFAGCKMLRRIVGISHVEDLESIDDVDVKSWCEIHGLVVAVEIIKNAHRYDSMKSVIEMAREKKPIL